MAATKQSGGDNFLDVDENDDSWVSYDPETLRPVFHGPSFDWHRKAVEVEDARRAKLGLPPLKFVQAFAFLEKLRAKKSA